LDNSVNLFQYFETVYVEHTKIVETNCR